MKIERKKGLSEIVSYVLLVVIAIGLSIMVYSYLKLYLPSDRTECPAGTSLIVEDARCRISINEKNISIKFSNQGLFNVSAAYVRISKTYKEVRFQINKDEESFIPPIPPGNFTWRLYNLREISAVSGQGLYTLEVQPAIISKSRLIPCEAIITQTINCTAAQF